MRGDDWLDAADDVPLGVAATAGGFRAWTTTRANGSYGLTSAESVRDVLARWATMQEALAALGIERLATAAQVHGNNVAVHGGEWRGWLRMQEVDGHVTMARGTALAVTIADCTPVFVWHPAGAVAVLHAGWRGTAAGIVARGMHELACLGFPAAECSIHLGPAICEACYEVGPEVLAAVTGQSAGVKGQLDVRAVLRQQAIALGVRDVSTSTQCTRCDNDRFFSHRAGDDGRQLGIIAMPA